MSKKELTHKRLKDLFLYNEETGDLIRKKTTSSRSIKNSIAGNKNSCGYLQVSISGDTYSVHRLIWFYVYGYFPENEIDHMNRIKTDNRIINLRETSHSCNIKNRCILKSNNSGITGVSFNKNRNNWQASIYFDGKGKRIGRYKDFSEAVCVRLAAEQCLNWPGCNKNSPAYKYVKQMVRG